MPQADQERPVVPFSSPEAAGDWTKGFLIATLVVTVFSVLSGLLQIELLSRLGRGSGFESEEATMITGMQGFFGFLYSLLSLGTAVPFLIWFHRLHKNLPSLGQTGLIFTPGWAVGFFFVPIFNLYRPFQAMREVWHGSDPERLELDSASGGPEIRSRFDTPPLVGWWWGLYIIPGIIGWIALVLNRVASVDQRLPGLPASVLTVVANLLVIAGAVVAIRLVVRLTKWQVEKAELIEQRGGLPAAAAAPRSRTKKTVLYVLLGLVGFAFIVFIGLAMIGMIFLSQTGGGLGDSPDQPPYEAQAPAAPTFSQSDLEAKVTRWSSRDVPYSATVEVTNRSQKTYHFVMVKVEFYDIAGRVVGTLMTDARGTEYIYPGAVKSFTVRGIGGLDFETVRASVVYSVEAK